MGFNKQEYTVSVMKARGLKSRYAIGPHTSRDSGKEAPPGSFSPDFVSSWKSFTSFGLCLHHCSVCILIISVLPGKCMPPLCSLTLFVSRVQGYIWLHLESTQATQDNYPLKFGDNHCLTMSDNIHLPLVLKYKHICWGGITQCALGYKVRIYKDNSIIRHTVITCIF